MHACSNRVNSAFVWSSKMKLKTIILFFSLVGIIKSETLDQILDKVNELPETRHFNSTFELSSSILNVVKSSIGLGCTLWNPALGKNRHLNKNNNSFLKTFFSKIDQQMNVTTVADPRALSEINKKWEILKKVLKVIINYTCHNEELMTGGFSNT